jgi:hypothetical protein
MVREMLGLPEYVVPAAMVVYGYPSEGALARKKPLRFDKDYIVYENQYHRLSKSDQEQMHRSRNQRAGISDKDVSEGIAAICNRKYMSEFSVEMNRSAAIYLKNFREE